MPWVMRAIWTLNFGICCCGATSYFIRGDAVMAWPLVFCGVACLAMTAWNPWNF
jgi:hypothetical protein